MAAALKSRLQLNFNYKMSDEPQIAYQADSMCICVSVSLSATVLGGRGVVHVCYHWHCKTSHLTHKQPGTHMAKKLNLLLLLAVVKQWPGIVSFVCVCAVSCIFLLAQVNCSACVALSPQLCSCCICVCGFIYVLSEPILAPGTPSARCAATFHRLLLLLALVCLLRTDCLHKLA